VRRRSVILFLAWALGAGAGSVARGETDLAAALRIVLAVGPEGQGNAAASRAWPVMAGADTRDLPRVLGAMDGANALAANWLRAAVDAIVERELRAGRALPLAELGEFFTDLLHEPRARRLAFEILTGADPALRRELLPTLLNDPSLELRRDAVQQLVDDGQKALATGRRAPALILFRQALGFARDVDQITGLATQLQQLDHPVDLRRHLGFLVSWKVIGPFDNTGGQGFEAVFPPEEEVDLAAVYPGKSGDVRWQDFTSRHELGLVDVNQVCGALKEVTAYAYAEFMSATSRPAELRLGCKNAWKVWWDGQLLFGREEYHRATEIDQFRLPIQLLPGRHRILVKLCQNELVEDWTKEWEFQLRVCDALGTAILSTDRSATPMPLPRDTGGQPPAR
jgi:hypothetical protein